MWIGFAHFCQFVATIGFALILYPINGSAGEVIEFKPRQTAPAPRTAETPKQPYHSDVSDFKAGELVLSKNGDVGQVLGIRGGKLIVEGRLMAFGDYEPSAFVKEVTAFNGIRTGSLVPDGVGGWGKILRIWEDGRTQIEGRRFDSTPYDINELDASKIVPPEEPGGILERCIRFLRNS